MTHQPNENALKIPVTGLLLAGCLSAGLALDGPAALAAAVPAPPTVAPEGNAMRAAAEAAFPNGVAAGDVSQDSAILWARLASPGAVTFEWGPDPSFRVISGHQTIGVTDPAIPAKADIGGLTAGTTYHYRAIGPGGAYLAGKFRTPAAPGQNPGRGLRFGVSGDWSQDLAPYPSIRNIPDRDLDFFVAFGDTIYADEPSPKLASPARTLPEFRIKYEESLTVRHGHNFWPAARASTPFFAMIDDHEVVNDFAGGARPSGDPRFQDQPGGYINETPVYRDGIRAFHEYMPIRQETWSEGLEPRFTGKPRLYRHRTFGRDAALFMVDARSFRDPPLHRVLSRNPWDAGTFLFAAAWPGRTLLGRSQLDRLKADLLAAHAAGIVWKFILIPEPIQNLGVLAADDRFEGYAAERTELLAFIHERGIQNVVFVTADFHGTLVNNLTYSWLPLTPASRTRAWEIVTGPVAIEPTLGGAIAQLAVKAGFMTGDEKARYATMSRGEKDRFLRGLIDRQIRAQLLDPLGLEDSGIPATLEQGDYVAIHSFGWTEFEITGPDLVVTTYGIDPYTREELEADPRLVVSRQPEIVHRFRVKSFRQAP